MRDIQSGHIRKGMKLEINGIAYSVLEIHLVKPGKGQAFTRTRLKNLKTSLVIEKTFKSNEKVSLADVEERKMSLLYQDHLEATFMDEKTFDQISLPLASIEDQRFWLMEEVLYEVLFHNGEVIGLSPPTFMEMAIVETDPGARGDSSGRVLKPAKTETGASIQVPIFIQKGEMVKVDTRTGTYVSRV